MLTVASEVPIEISPASIAARLDRDDAYYREVAQWQRVLEGRGRKLAGIIDTEQRPLWPGRLVVSDDHPLIEYPEVASKLLGREARRALEERRAAGADG